MDQDKRLKNKQTYIHIYIKRDRGAPLASPTLKTTVLEHLKVTIIATKTGDNCVQRAGVGGGVGGPEGESTGINRRSFNQKPDLVTMRPGYTLLSPPRDPITCT